MLWVSDELKKYLLKFENSFKQMMDCQGEIYREQKGRKTQRIKIGEQSYFLKSQRGVGWLEIFKNLIQGKKPVLSAQTEWQAILHLQKIGIAVPSLKAYGVQGFNPAYLQSFVLMEDIHSSISLEELTKQWQTQPPSFILKRFLIAEIATIARKMHASGMHHQDFYLCHFLLRSSDDLKHKKIYLIDLHRAHIHSKLSIRWRIKDLAALYFSSYTAKLTKNDLYFFMKCYHQKSLKLVFKQDMVLWKKVKQRGEQLYRDHF